MENELEGLCESLRALSRMEHSDFAIGDEAADRIAELARENAKLQGDIALSDQCGAQMEEVKNGWIARAHRAEAELAALRKRVGDAPTAEIRNLTGNRWSFREWDNMPIAWKDGKRIRLVEESV